MAQREVVSTGFVQKVNPVNRTPDYDPRTAEHLWVVITCYQIDPERWNSDDPTVIPILDVENLLSVTGVGCYYCEEYYTPRLGRRRCPGVGRTA